MREPIVRLAVIGAAGRQGHRRLEAFSTLPGCRLCRIVDLPEKRAVLAQLAPRFRCRIAADVQEALDDAETDAVVLCTPTDTHAAIGLRALEKGKHVFVEKPLDSYLDLAERMVALARRRGRVLHVGMNFRYRDPVKAAFALLASGAIGAVQHVRAHGGHSQFVGAADDDRRRSFLESAGSGPLLDLGVHLIDLGRLALGRPAFRRAQGAEARGDLLPRHVPQVETAAFVAADGRTLTVESSYIEARPFMGTSLDVLGGAGRLRINLTADAVLPVHAVELVVRDGSACDAAEVERILTRRGLRWTEHAVKVTGGARAHRVDFEFPDDCWRDDCEAFLQAACDPAGEAGNGQDGLEALKLIAAARESARCGGQPVAMEPGLLEAVS